MAEKEWIEIGPVIGDTGHKGDTGDTGIGTIIKGHYDNYADFISVHPSGSLGDAYIVDGSYYYWNENGWANAGSVKGDTGETGAKGDKGDKGIREILVRKAIQETQVRLEQLVKKENKDLKEILEIQELLAILERPGQRGTLELLVLVLLLKVHIILTRN